MTSTPPEGPTPKFGATHAERVARRIDQPPGGRHAAEIFCSDPSHVRQGVATLRAVKPADGGRERLTMTSGCERLGPEHERCRQHAVQFPQVPANAPFDKSRGVVVLCPSCPPRQQSWWLESSRIDQRRRQRDNKSWDVQDLGRRLTMDDLG